MTPQQIVTLIQKTLASDAKTIALHEPSFAGNEWTYVKDCLDTGWVSSVGQYVDRFEKDLADFTGAKYAVATTNGTSALHVCYLLAGLGANDEVLMPTMTFVATTNALAYTGAIPHFIDADEQTLGIDVAVLDAYLGEISDIKNGVCINRQSGRPIRALCVMHTLGHPVDLDPIVALCEKYHLTLLEDAAEALGSYYKGQHVGHKGLVGALSFNGNKIITTGGGGAILTNHGELAKRAKHITTTAKQPHAYAFTHDQIAYNYRLPNINAALGCAQLELLPRYLEIKRQIAAKYAEVFANIPGIRFIQEPHYAKSNYWLNAILLDDADEEVKGSIIQALIAAGIYVRPLWDLQHTLPTYRHCPRMDMPVTERLFKRLIKLPSGVKVMNEMTKPVLETA